MFIFTGGGGSGKSTLIDTYSLFFDEKQITALDMEDLARKGFDKESLLTSRVNFCAEAKKGFLARIFSIPSDRRGRDPISKENR